MVRLDVQSFGEGVGVASGNDYVLNWFGLERYGSVSYEWAGFIWL